MLQYGVVCCSYKGRRVVMLWWRCLECFICLLQCAAVCCSVLQCAAVCCSVLQRVAVCCGYLEVSQEARGDVVVEM